MLFQIVKEGKKAIVLLIAVYQVPAPFCKSLLSLSTFACSGLAVRASAKTGTTTPVGRAARGREGQNLFLHNFSGRLWEQFTHFPVLLWADLDLLFAWEATTPHLRHLAMVTCHCCDSVWVSTSPSEVLPQYLHWPWRCLPE